MYAIQIEWNSNGLAYSMQHFGYYLIANNLINAKSTTELLCTHHLFLMKFQNYSKENLYNEVLLKKLYWDYRDSYNPAMLDYL